MKHLWMLVPLLAGPAAAHEFWLDPVAGQVPAGAPLMADFRVGSDLEGAAYSYNTRNIARFEIWIGDQVIEVEGRAGDKPALNMAVPGEGLATVVHLTRDYKLTYAKWDLFKLFCTHKDFTWAIDRHLERGLPQEKVREVYSRHAKALFAVGSGVGADRVTGLEVEIVALDNPYTADLSGGMAVQVLYQGKPRPDGQVELFEQAPDGSVEVRLYRSDAQGIARIEVKPGHEYLVDHVEMRELEVVEDGDPAWESVWASLTFQVPE